MSNFTNNKLFFFEMTTDYINTRPQWVTDWFSPAVPPLRCFPPSCSVDAVLHFADREGSRQKLWSLGEIFRQPDGEFIDPNSSSPPSSLVSPLPLSQPFALPSEGCSLCSFFLPQYNGPMVLTVKWLCVWLMDNVVVLDNRGKSLILTCCSLCLYVCACSVLMSDFSMCVHSESPILQ